MTDVSPQPGEKQSAVIVRRIAGIAPWFILAMAVWMVGSQVRNPRYLWTVFTPWAEIGMLAIAMTPIIITGGIDLSVGSIVALSGVVLGVLWRDAGLPVGVAVLLAIGSGTLAGALNGGLVVIGLSPLVATLATMAFFRGLAMAISDARQVDRFPASFLDWDRIGGIPMQFWLLGGVISSVFVVVHLTRYGRCCFAIGDNPVAARFAAVPVGRIQWMLYTGCGFVCSLVAVTNAMTQDVVLPDAQIGVELSAIACVVLGGTLITGGRGGVHRSVLGLAIVASLDVGLRFQSSSIPWLTADSRLIVIGILLMAVAVLNERATRSGRE